jgi:hypothetical protein
LSADCTGAAPDGLLNLVSNPERSKLLDQMGKHKKIMKKEKK